MIKSLRGLCMSASVLALTLMFATQAEANSHIQAIKTKTAAQYAILPSAAASNISAANTRAQYNYIAAISKQVVARQQFVNYLLYEEAAAIQRNNVLLNQRTVLGQQVSYLETLNPTTPQQASIINRMIMRDQTTLNRIQYQLNLNYVHLVTTIPGIEYHIALNLNTLGLVAPYNPQVARYVTNVSTLQQTFSTVLQGIITQIPASF